MSSALTLALWLSTAAAPKAAQAVTLAKSAQWADLYLAFASVSPKGYGAKDKGRIATALAEGCVALRDSDAVMAYSLGEKSVQFALKADPALCAAAAALATDQRGAAEGLLEKGRRRFPKDGRFPLELGRLALKEKDYAGAVKALTAVSAKSKQRTEAQTLLEQARKGLNEQRSEDGLVRGPSAAGSGRGEGPGGPAVASRGGRPGGPDPMATDSLTYKETTDALGRQVMYNARFRFKYFKAGRDFGQRADYEYRIRQTLDEVYDAASRALGTPRKAPLDVILYSKAEFEAQFGSRMAVTVAGLYMAGAIHMNDSANITDEVKATLVHEYTHAIVDELSSFKETVPTWLNEGVAEYTKWTYQGLDGPPYGERTALKQAALAGQLPSLQSLASGSLLKGNPGLNYAFAGAAATELAHRRGVSELVQLIRDLGANPDLERALQDHYGRGLAAFDEDLHHSLGGR